MQAETYFSFAYLYAISLNLTFLLYLARLDLLLFRLLTPSSLQIHIIREISCELPCAGNNKPTCIVDVAALVVGIHDDCNTRREASSILPLALDDHFARLVDISPIVVVVLNGSEAFHGISFAVKHSQCDNQNTHHHREYKADLLSFCIVFVCFRFYYLFHCKTLLNSSHSLHESNHDRWHWHVWRMPSNPCQRRWQESHQIRLYRWSGLQWL